MAEQDYSTLSEDELQKVVDSNGAYDPFAGNDAETANQNGGAEPDYSNMSEADLQRIIDSNGEWMPEQKREDYGFMERQNDQITAEGGRDAYPGQALIEGATPLTRAMRQGKERDEDKELGAWLSDGEDNTLRVALKKHGLERDPSLEGYKAKETGGFWEGFGDDMSRTLAQLPFGAGWLFRKAREADNPQKYATDHLMQSAFLSGFSRADIEQAKEFSQGDPAKMYDFFAERAEGRLKGFAAKKQGAQEKLAAHQDDQGFLEKVGSGTLGMAPMLMEFALGGAAGKVLTGATKLNAIARAAGTGTWKGRLVNGIVHGVGTTGVLGPEMVRRGVGELTADEYGVDENGNLLKRKGDDTATALKKAIPGRLSEVAIFSMPFGEAALGWATPAITKALRTKVGQTAAKFYENYVKYGQMTGLRGQPQMLALMDLNAFKDEVLGWGVKDADYEGREAAWQKFKDETLSIKGQTDLLVGALGVMLAQGSVAGANAWRQGRAQKLSNDRRLHAAFNIPQEQLEKMEPELKRMLVRVGDNLYNGRDAFGRSKVRAEQDRMHGKDVGTFEERLKRWCDKVGERLGKASGEVFDEAGKYALEFDNSFGWEKDAGTGQFASRFQVPEAREMRVGRDGVGQEHSMIPWEDVDVPLGNGVSVEGKQFTDPNTGISVLRYLRTDAKAGDNGYIYLIRDENGHRATRYGSADAMDAARAMDVVNQRNESMRNVKAQMADKIRASMPALEGTDMFYAKDGAEFDAVLQQFSEKPIEPTGEGVRGVTLPNGRVMLCLDRIENPQQMKDTMLHEAGRHAGLDLALPDVADKMGFVAGLAKSGDPVVQNQLNRIVEARMAKHEIERPEDIFKRDKNGNYLHANALEEVYAHLFDRSDVPEEAGWWDAHMNAMRRNIRKVFKGLSYSRSEAEEMYHGAMEKLKEQTGYSFYEPEVSPRERMVAEQRQREENQRIGHEAERDVAEIRDDMEREDNADQARRDNIRLADDLQEKVREDERLDSADPFVTEMEKKRRKEMVDARIAREMDEAAARREEGRRKDKENRRRGQEKYDRQMEEREERKYQAGVEKQKREAEAVRAAEERQKETAEREEQRRAVYDAADRQARIDRKTGIKQAFREDDARKGEEYDRAEEERKRREAEEEAALPKITVAEEPQGKERTAPQNDALRVNYGPNGNQIIARRVTDESGKVIGWDVNAVGNDGTETYIASTTKPKKDGLAAIRAVRRQIHDHFGLPYGKEARDAMDAERRRLEEAERTGDRKDEARTVRDEEQPQPEPREERLSAEGEDEGFAETGNPQGEERDAVVVHHANEGREGDGVKAAEDALQGLFGDEGITSRPEGAESVEARSRASDDDLAFLRSLPPDFKFFDQSEGLMDDKRRDGNQKLVNLIGNLYDRKKIRGFGGFAKLVKAENPAIWAEQKDRLRGLWNYAAELSDGEIPRVGDNEARDAIRSADEGRNVRDVSGINALQAALQNIDVEMYPAAKLDRSDDRIPNTKLKADPRTGIIKQLPGTPRSLLSKPILGVEFEDGTVSVGTGRHRSELYSRYGMDIPMRRLREADGWVTKKPDGTYDYTKIRLLDALDNIQDSKGDIEDYVSFFKDVKIPRSEAESEGFLGSKEARIAYALANDAHPDIRNAANFEGGRRDGMISPEQAGAIADVAPLGGWDYNASVQHELLKDVLKDRSMDATDIQVDAGIIADDIRREIAAGKVFQPDLLGDVMDAGAELREKKREYIRDQISHYERLAKDIRSAKNSENGLKIAREDMRRLGINERNIAKGGIDARREYEAAAQRSLMRAMEWRSGMTTQLKPEDRAQMEKDLGIAPTTAEKTAESGRDFALESVTQGQINAETEAQRQRDEIKRRLEAPLKAGAAEDGQTLMDLGGQEGENLFNKVRFYDEKESAKDFEKRQYAPSKYRVPGAVKSRTLLEEPPALRATEPPDNDYKIQIPPKHIKNGDLQEHQLEFVGYAGRAHGMKDANGSSLGMMGGYGTGAGKSRMIAGTILDNRWRGRNRALWITTQRGLIDDVRSECEPFGMGNLVEDIGDKPVPKNGIGFTTYSNLRNEGVVQKIAKELGKDFDGVIAFDEIHRAKTEGGRTQDAVVKLQELLPKAKVIYMSATGATDVGNLGYATRLGLWGEGTPFKDFEDFKNKVEGKGVSAMEMVARTLKRRGQYLSANLSKEGVEFDHVAVPTTDAQKRTYTEYNNALKDVYRGVYDALEVLGRLDYKVPPSSLHGMQQRLHYSMVTALKIPTLIERAKQELAKGNVPVFSLVNTNEAGATREVAKALEEGRQISMDEVNFGPKQILLDFLTKEGDKTYKTKGDTHIGYKDYQFPTMKPIKDAGGEVIGFERDQIADGIRRRLVSEVEKLPDDFGNPINMIIDAFGKDNVANLTGLNREGMAKDYKAFQDGDKKVLVFSGVANTGYTFSSDRKYKNQARRVAFPLQLGYRADELEQTLGRVHRNNQANAPIYVASTTDLPGERRFYSSVERRRGQMKALTTGDRAATGNGITSEGDNFETKYAQQAVDAIIATLHRMGKLDEIAREMNFIKRIQKKDGTIAEVNGMLKRDKSGAILPNVSAKRFLNRLLMLDPNKQDNMFSAFKNYLDQIVRWAKEDGEYDIGLQDIGSTHNDPVRSVKLADDMDVAHINSWFKTDKVSFDDFAKAHASEFLTYVRNKRTGETFAVRADGKMGKKQEPAAMRYAVDGTKRRMKASILDTEKPNAAYERLDTAKAKEFWDAEYGVIPDERADDGFYATGDLLKHWNDVLGSKPPRTFRVKAGDAPEYIGAKIDTDEIPAIFGRFGKAEEARDMVIDGKVREVLNNRTVDLVNGWTLKQVPRDGAKKVMVRGVEPTELDAVAKELGGEVSKKRIFMEPDAAKLRKIIEEHPANLYRDDEKIGDTGNLRFFNIDEEAGRRVHAKDLDEARRMEGAGVGRREIWEKTGWWKAKDGKWRYEIAGISDADTKRMLDFALASGKFYDRDRANVYSFTLNDLEAAMRERGEHLPDSVKTLLAAYPKLGKETIEVDRMAAQPTDGTLGYATKGKIHLYERGTTADTLNHELQHRIQAASGMAGGTNTDGKSFGRYTQEHGEWEARQAATRAGMDADERGRTAPWETSDRHGVAEDMTQIDDANRARIRPDGEPEEPEPAAPAADRDTTLGEKYRTNVTDRYDAIKQMEIATGKRDKKDLHVENSPYNAMRLLHGHNEAARQRYEKIWKRPFEDMLRKSGVTADDVGMYMIAENAKDRNRKVMDRSGVLDGAGLSDADADRLKSDLRSRLGDAKMQKIQEMANFLWKMQKEGMARRVESGRVSKEMADQWETEEPHHVPMRDDLSDENGEYNRSTRQWTQNDYRKAEGRYTLPDNPVEFMFKEYQDAMYGSNINEARRKLADFVRTTPGIGKIRKGVRIGKGWSFTHGQMENFADPNYREQTVKGGAGKPNLVSFKEGGDLYMIELNGKQGERVAEAVIGRGVHNIGASKDSGAAAKLYAKGMRAYASTATEWSIPFLGRNVIADMIEASINTMADKGVIKGGAAAVKNAINAIRMSGTIYKYIKDGKFEGKFADVMRRYVESGSLIGGMGNEGVTEIKTDLGKVEAGKHGVLDVVKFMGRGISGINKMGELATRLAVFKNYIDGGASDGEASMRSREYSTDFNKYGNQRWMNSVWMFSGSVIGGATRQMASLALGKHGVQTITALFSYGVAEALLEHFYNADDDEKAKRTGASSGQTMNEHYRANSLYFRIGDRFIRIPFHAGPFSMIKYAGNLVARLALGDIDGAEFAKRLGKESVDNGMHFTGTGDFNSDTIAQSIAPTLAVPFVQAKGNENYLGNPIAKRMYSETKPYSENGRKYTSDVWKGIARGMNALGGGNEKRRGLELFDNRPEMYKNAWDSLGKNVTRDISTVVDFVTDLIEGKTIDNRHKPVLGDYWKDVPDNTDNFYDAERLYKSRRADGTIKQGSRRDEAVKKLLREIDTLRHWEAGEEKKSGKWVPMRKAPSESAKEKNKKMRLKYQQQVINLMNR